MAVQNEWFRTVLPLVMRLPDGTWFENGRTPGHLEVQAYTQDQVRAITAVFPGAVWRKEWEKSLQWWTYTTATPYEGTRIKIYGVREGPATCRAIFETRTVERKIPVMFETTTTEEPVLVGWDCGEPGKEPDDLGIIAAPENAEASG